MYEKLIYRPISVHTSTQYSLPKFGDSEYLPLFTNNDIDQEKEDIIIEDLPSIEMPIIEKPDYVKPILHSLKVPNYKSSSSLSTPGEVAFDNAFASSGVSYDRYAFFSKLAKMESGYNPTIQNSAGYPAWGYFQFMDGTYTDASGNTRSWSNIKDIANVDISTFLNNPVLQIQSANKLADKFLSNFDSKDLKQAKKLGYSASALVAGAWLAGPGGVKKFLHEGKNASDAHGTNIKQRMDEFNNYFKDGGVLKFQHGGVNDAKTWYENWINRRADIYNSNLRDYSILGFGSLGRNLALKNLGLANVEINPNKVPAGANGVFRPTSRTISLVNANPYTAVHEFAHSTLPSSQVNKIDKIKDIHSNKLFLNKDTKEDSYLDSSEEIYSRYMVLRYFLEQAGYDMNKKFTAEDVRNILDTYTRGITLKTDKGIFIKNNDGKVLKNTIDESFSIDDSTIERNIDYRVKDTIGRYDLDFSAKVLSDVASIHKEVPQFIKSGGKVLKFQKGVSKKTLQWASDMNGKVKDAKNKGLHYPEFWDNLRDPERPWSIDSWGYPYTHKMSWGESDNKYIVYPEAQVENGKLIDYSYDRDLALQRALVNGEYVVVPSAEIAEEFTQTYKDMPWYKGFDYRAEESKVPYRKAKGYQPHFGYNFRSSDLMDVPVNDPVVKDTSFIPTIEDLARQLTAAYETYQSKPYILVTENKDGSINKQELIGHGLSNKDIINKYRNSGIPEDVSMQLVIEELNRLHNNFKKRKNYNSLPWNVQLAILDTAYNTSGDSFWVNSPKFAEMVSNGITDPNELVKELDHSADLDNWLGDRSAARRALAKGEYRWNWQYVDKYGRHYDPNKKLGSKDWRRSLYLGNY